MEKQDKYVESLCLASQWESYSSKKEHGKCPKISNSLFHTFFASILLFMWLFLKIPSGMANSVDPDQTAPLGAV